MTENKQPTVLVVDDEVEVTYTLQVYFERKGYKMLTAFDGEQAMKILGNEAIDLVLLDLRMPGVNGIEVLRYIRKNVSGTRVIVITAYDDEYKQVVEKIGVHGFLNKPFGVEGLSRVVEQVLDKPAGETGSVAPASEDPKEDFVPKAKLLFLEPSEYLFNIKRVFFEQENRSGGCYEVDAAYSSKELMEKLGSFKPNIVLLDLLASGELGDLATHIMASDHAPQEVVVYGSGTPPTKEKEGMRGLSAPGIQVVWNEAFTEAGLKRLSELVRRVAREHSLKT